MHDRRSSEKHRTPLVLAITGPTGTGKTETSNLIAESLFKRKKKLRNSDKEVSSGLLVFRYVTCIRWTAGNAECSSCTLFVACALEEKTSATTLQTQ